MIGMLLTEKNRAGSSPWPLKCWYVALSGKANRRGAASFKHKNQVFIKMPLGVCVFARSYLQDICTGCSLRAFHIDEGSFSSGSVPRLQFNLLQILDKKGLNYGYAFLELPFLIVRNVVH